MAKNKDQIIAEIIAEVKNQRKHDKFSIAYMLGMLDRHDGLHYYPEMYKRNLLLERFESLLNKDDNYLKLSYGFRHIFNS